MPSSATYSHSEARSSPVPHSAPSAATASSTHAKSANALITTPLAVIKSDSSLVPVKVTVQT